MSKRTTEHMETVRLQGQLNALEEALRGMVGAGMDAVFGDGPMEDDVA